MVNSSTDEGAARGAPSLFDPRTEATHDEVDVQNRPFVPYIFDVCLTLGPRAVGELVVACRAHIGFAAKREREFRHMDLRESQRAFVTREVNRGLARGWLVRADDDRIDVGELPPTHVALTAIASGGTPHERAENATSMLVDHDLREAREALRDGSLRREPSPERVERLLNSLMHDGLCNAITRYHEVGRDAVIVDGVIRERLCLKLGLPVRYDDLPPTLSPLAVVRLRIASEIVRTTKDDDDLPDYIERAEARFSNAWFAEAQRAKRDHVAGVTRRVRVLQGGRTSPIDSDVDEFVKLREDGLDLRMIAVTTGFSKAVIAQQLCDRLYGTSERTRVGSAESIRAQVLAFIRARGALGATDGEIQKELSITPSTEVPRRGELVKAKLVRPSRIRRATDSARTAKVWMSV
jgi:hypothetical protein